MPSNPPGRAPAVWTDRWMRQLSWRQLQEFIRLGRANMHSSRLTLVRQRRLEAEMDRRKREGMGGMCAE